MKGLLPVLLCLLACAALWTQAVQSADLQRAEGVETKKDCRSGKADINTGNARWGNAWLLVHPGSLRRAS